MSRASVAVQRNPFPGLRPFREDEEYLFFGRENQVDAMVDKLAATRVLAVVGTSGSGKSSLVNCGLRPALHGGLMARAGTSWRMAQFRPGSDPMQAMARALAEDGVLFRDYQAGGLTLAEIVDTTLRMSKLGLIDIYEQAQLEKDVNLLVVVDQFEELFRYRRLAAGQQENVYGVSEEATAFVNLLLEAKDQTTYPIYIVLTMRSDFLGDCAQFTGLAEAINAGQYLVPRMTRDERRAAISGPVGVGGAEISPVLLTRLINDVGDNPDQLSILQHALNRTWYQRERSGDNGTLDLTHYEAIGTMAHALDQHAERAYAELATERQRQICEKLFKALTDKATDPRGVRRPTTLGTLCALGDAAPAEVTEVIDVFRKPSRSFLMPPIEEALQTETVIDISHESLMRVWERLKTWVHEEAQSAQTYSRLAETAVLHGAGQAGLWQDPDLQVALKWHEHNQPNEVWARRYNPEFTSALGFLKKSKAARGRRRWTLAGITLLVFAALSGFLVYALLAKSDANKQTIIAEAVGAKDLLDSKPSDGLIAAIVSADDARGAFSSDKVPAEVRSSFIEALQLLQEGGVPRNAWIAHDGETVNAVAMSDDGQTIVTGGWDAKVRLWNKEGDPIGVPFAGAQGVESVSISSDGQTIVSAGDDGIRLWDRRGGEPTKLRERGEFWSVSMTPDGQTIALAGRSNEFLMNRSGTPLNQKGFGDHRDDWPTVSISADGQTVVRSELGRVWLSDGKGEDIWKKETEKEKDQDRDRSNGATTAAISRDGRMIVIGYENGYIRLWNRQGEPLVEEPEQGDAHEGKVTCVAVSADGQTIVSGGEQGTVRLWNRKSQPVGPPLRGHDGTINSVAVNADGKFVVSAGNDGMVRLWERRTPSESVKAYEGKVDSMAFSGDGQTIVVAGPGARILRWNRDGAPARDSTSGPSDGHVTAAVEVTATAWSPDGELLVVGRSDGKLLLRHHQDPISDKAFGGDHTAPVTSIAVSGDGKMIASGDENGIVRLWNQDGRPIGKPSQGHEGRVVSVAVSFNGRTIVSGGSDGKVLRWNLQGSAVSPPLGTSFSSGKGEAVAVSPDGQTIASGSELGMLRFWDGKGNRIRVFKGHEENVSCVAFSPDGETIVSAADDGTVRLWDRHGKPIGHPFIGHAAITSVALSPDGNTLVSGDKAGNVMVRQIGIETFLRKACDWMRYHRGITSPETDKEKRAAKVAKSFLKS